MLQRDPLEKVRARTQQGLVLLTDITPTVSIFGSAYITRQHIPHPVSYTHLTLLTTERV